MRFMLAATAALLAVACSGSGGGGDGVLVWGGGFSVAPEALTFTCDVDGPECAPQTFRATWTATDAVYFGAALPQGVRELPPWLRTPAGRATGLSAAVMDVSVNASGAQPGVHSAVLLLGIARADRSIIGYRSVTVTLVLRSLRATPAAISARLADGGSGAATAATSLAAAAPTAWRASADRSWIHLGASAGTTPSTLALTLDPAGLASGTHAGTVTVTAGGETLEVPVAFTIGGAATLAAAPDAVQLRGFAGRGATPAAVHVSLDTGTAAYPWTAVTADGWLELARTDLQVSSAGAELTVRPSAAAAALAPGAYHGAVTLGADVGSVHLVTTVAVSYVVEEAKLLTSSDGIALTSTPGLSRLSRSVIVKTDRGIAGAWKAASDRAWLAVVEAGHTGDALVLTADPAGLASGALHEATVTVSSEDPALARGSARIRVGLWVGATPDPISLVTMAVPEAVAVDPVRPVLYLSDGSGTITAFHVHTGKAVQVLARAGAAFTGLAASSDGASLFALDRAARSLVRFDLDTLAPAGEWSFAAADHAVELTYVRIGGVPALVTNVGGVYSAATGAQLATYPTYGTAEVAVSADGTRLCAFPKYIHPCSATCWRLEAGFMPSEAAVTLGPPQEGPVASNGCSDVALSPDGARVYFAALGLLVLDATQGDLATVATLPGASALDVDPDGRIFAAASRPASLGGGLGLGASVYDSSGALLGWYELGDLHSASLAATGDGLRVVLVTGSTYDSAIRLLTVGP